MGDYGPHFVDVGGGVNQYGDPVTSLAEVVLGGASQAELNGYSLTYLLTGWAYIPLLELDGPAGKCIPDLVFGSANAATDVIDSHGSLLAYVRSLESRISALET